MATLPKLFVLLVTLIVLAQHIDSQFIGGWGRPVVVGGVGGFGGYKAFGFGGYKGFGFGGYKGFGFGGYKGFGYGRGFYRPSPRLPPPPFIG